VESGKELSLDEFRSSIPKQRIMAMKIITFALVFGPCLFAVVAGTVANNSQGKDLEILQTVNFILTAMMIVMSTVIPKFILKSQMNNDAVNGVLNKIQSAVLVRLALVEGAALFGGVCVLLGLGYINYISMAPLFIVALTNLPTEKYLCRQFIIHIKKDPRLLVEIGEY